ncbi:MAG: M15 family metallopeptidase [Minisyncoccia bacterium]
MKSPSPTALALLGILLLGGVGGYVLYTEKTAHQQTRTALGGATSTIDTLESELARAKEEERRLTEALSIERDRNNTFEGRIKEISGTVDTLDKLAKTDPELLQKYSKVYFLNENFVPSELVQIPPLWTYGEQEEYFHGKLWNDLEKLLEDAREEEIEFRIISGYRSFGTQEILKSNYVVRYGSGANAFSADQGYSEHQLGTTVDFTTLELGANFSSLDTTEAYAWLLAHAREYGFILSYPKENGYYVYEPWHWRYVGRALADDLYDEGKNFYDLDQRELDEYLVDFF